MMMLVLLMIMVVIIMVMVRSVNNIALFIDDLV